jgi:CheY-like chemotaxis protein
MNRTALCQSLTVALPDLDERQSLRILVAESNGELRRLLSLVLRTDGHEVIEAADGGETLEAIAALILDGDRQRFDLVIADQGIPGIPGLSVLAGLRSRGRDTPFILMTVDTAVAARARRLGAVILDRPLNVEAIRGAVRRAEALLASSGGDTVFG